MATPPPARVITARVRRVVIAGLVVVTILVLYELRATAPMLAFRLFANRAFRSANVVGFFGMGADAYVTWKLGRYAERELLPRARR